MIPTTYPRTPARRTMLSFASFVLTASAAWAQSAATPAAESPATARAPGATTESSSVADDEVVLIMSPFEVTSEDGSGYVATRTMSGTRLNTRLEDIAAAVSVVTKEQLLDTAAIDLNDIFLYEASTEGTHQYTDYAFVAGSGSSGDTFVDNTGTSPATANRIRGLGSANLSIGGFERTGAIPVDTYNVDLVEISRGPNSNIFGLGDAAGTVNLITSQANLSRKSTSVTLRGDSYGGWRASGDYNVPLIRDALSVRFIALREDKGFTRNPSYDKTDRQTIAVTVRPFPKTTIRGSFENYENRNSLPNSITPRDLVTPWLEAGRPTWNPLTRTLKKQDGTVLASGVTWNNRASQLFRPGYGVNSYADGFANYVNQFIDNGEMALYTVGRLVGTTTGTPGPITSLGQNGYFIGTGELFDPQHNILWKSKGVTDRSIYDYNHLNFSGANFSIKDSQDLRASIEQEILRNDTHYLAAQFAYYRQKVASQERNFIGSSGGIPTTLMVDINETLLDGTPNPFLLRPFMAGSEPQKREGVDESSNYRAQVAYVLDLTKKDGWLRWLGRQNFVAYGEDRQRISGTLGFRDYITSVHSWLPEFNTNGTVRSKVSNSYRQTVRYYMGDANGFNIDYAPKALASAAGQQSLYWYNGNSRTWITEPVTFEELHDANRLKKEERYTLGGVWQANLFKDTIVPTVGYRDDRLTEFESPSRVIGPDGYPDLTPLRNFNDPDFAYNKGRSQGVTRTAGVVLKPLPWLHLHYNQSNNFRPAGIAYNVTGDVLPNPLGEGKDYGVSVNLFQGRLSIRYNQYQTLEENARTGGSSSTMTSRMQRIDFDISRTSDRLPDVTDRWHLEASAYRWVLATHRVSPADRLLLTPEQSEVYRQEAWKTYIEPAGLAFDYRTWFMDGPTKVFADTNTAKGRGREVEVAYNPSRFFTLKSTLSQVQAVDSGVSVANTEWLNTRLPYWESVKVPTDLVTYNVATSTWVPDPNAGASWWTTADTAVTTQVPQAWFLQNVDSQMALINARAGQKKPQIREWRFNATARLDLAVLKTENFLKNMNVGASLRWADKAAIGYLALEPDVLTPSFVYYRYDVNKPVYDKATTEADLMVNYRFQLFQDKVRVRLQLNVLNVLESGGLRVIGVNPDGEARDFRIVDPRKFTVTSTFDF